MANDDIEHKEPRARSRERAFEESPAFQYYAAFLVLALVTVANLFLASYAGYWSAAIVYLAAIGLSAIRLGSGPVIFEAFLTALAWDYLFIPPRFTFAISRTEDVLMLALYFVVSLGSGLATARLRASERRLKDYGERLEAIDSLAVELAGTGSAGSILALGLAAIRRAAGCDAIAILADGGTLRRGAEDGWEPLDGAAREAARRCFEGGAPAGRFSDEPGGSDWLFLPLVSPRGGLGVIGLRPASDAARDDPGLRRLEALAAVLALALSRDSARS
jgi:two-component system, OmpR family, sensor histidine kinase KdpD